MTALSPAAEMLVTWAAIHNNRILASRRHYPGGNGANGAAHPGEAGEGSDEDSPGSYVLLVDPDKDAGAAVVDALRARGYEVEWFLDGEEAITFIQKEFAVSQRSSLDRALAAYTGREDELPRVRPDAPRVPALILIDLLVPVSNGWRLAATIQSRDALRQVPMMVIAADPRIGTRDDLLKIGRRDTDLATLVAAVERLAGPPSSPRE